MIHHAPIKLQLLSMATVIRIKSDWLTFVLMKNILSSLAIGIFAFLLSSCGDNKTEGTIRYTVVYELPDSLKQYAAYLPKTALVYFKGDSTVSIQPTDQESTTVITNHKTNFMRALLKSTDKKFVVDYDKGAQAEEKLNQPAYTYVKTAESKIIAGYNAKKYTLRSKFTDDVAEAWFTRDLQIIPNSLTSIIDTSLGVPLAFTIRQNGLVVKTTVVAIEFKAVPDGVFNTPKGYEFLTLQQFKMMTAGK
jgi:hypothetical protein